MNYEQAIGRTVRNTEGDLRVWHIPQVPGRPFYVRVNSPAEARKILNMLIDYDEFQYKENVKGDYSSANGLEVLEDDGWAEWYSDDGYGYGIDEYAVVAGKLVPLKDLFS